MLTFVVSASSLNLREQPRIDAGVLDTLKQNEQVKFLEASPDNYWFKVQREGGEVGWASHKFLSPKTPPAEAPRWMAIAQGELGVCEEPGRQQCPHPSIPEIDHDGRAVLLL